MAAKVLYQIVGRYMDGKEVTGYHLQGNNGKSGRYTREQVAYLVGRDQITNCTGQIYQDKLILRGVGVSLDSLPVQQEGGSLSRTDNIGKVRKGTSAADAMTQVMLVKAIVNGRNVIGYIVQNAGGATQNINRQQTLELAKAGRIGNARYQESNGKPILRGVNTNLNDLPTVSAEELSGKSQTTKNTSVKKDISSKNNRLNPNPFGNVSLLNANQIEFAKQFNNAVLNTFKKYNEKYNNKLVALYFNPVEDLLDQTMLSRFDFEIRGRKDIYPFIGTDGRSIAVHYSTDNNDEFDDIIRGANQKSLDSAFRSLLNELDRIGAFR